jgi:Type II site-specific deoxyribonuclease
VKLTTTEARHVDELLAALRGPCAETFNPGFGFNQAFADDFRASLMVHHYYLQATLGTDFFESAFAKAARAGGHNVVPASDGGRFWDVEIDKRKISLKSSAAAAMSRQKLHISKLCEAAWIQDMRSAAQREARTKELFGDYTHLVDSIIQLRYFKKTFTYELVEIPCSLLSQILDVPRMHFSADGPRIGIPVGKDPPDFTLNLDRSDAKVTLTNINKGVCKVIGEWKLDPRTKPA